jgi:homoaconitase
MYLHVKPTSYAKRSEQKQGILPLWFTNVNDYSKIGYGDTIETIGLADLFNDDPDASIRLRVTKRDGTVLEISTRHTMSKDQLKWLRAGSALNHIRSQL